MLKMGAESGTVEDSEREMINSVFSFGDKSARELMVREEKCLLWILRIRMRRF